jgi:hypothetical protein
MSYWDPTLTPAPACGDSEHMGDSPYPLADSIGVSPDAPVGGTMGDTPYPIDSSGETTPAAPRKTGVMPMHPHQAKPGSFA